MANYAISYRIHEDSSYAERRDSLVKEIAKCAAVWDETTSFALVTTMETLSSLEFRLYHSSDLLSSKDKLLVIDVTGDKAIARGMSYIYTLGGVLPGTTIV